MTGGGCTRQAEPSWVIKPHNDLARKACSTYPSGEDGHLDVRDVGVQLMEVQIS